MSDQVNAALQSKIDRQRVALDRLNRKVSTQRFRLNLLKELGRDVSYEEYAEAKAKLEEVNPAHADRIDQYETLEVV